MLGRLAACLRVLMRQPVAPRAAGAAVDDPQLDAGAPAVAQQPAGEPVHVVPIRPQARAEVEHHHQLGVPALAALPWQVARQLPGGELLRDALEVERAGAGGAEVAAQRGQQARLRQQVFVGGQAAWRAGLRGFLVERRFGLAGGRGRRLGRCGWAPVALDDRVREGHAQRQPVRRRRRAGCLGGRQRQRWRLGRRRRLGQADVAEPQAVVDVEREPLARRHRQRAQQIGASERAARGAALAGAHRLARPASSAGVAEAAAEAGVTGGRSCGWSAFFTSA